MREMPLNRTPYVSAAVVAVLASLLLLVASCSSEQPQGQAGEDRRSGEPREVVGGAQTGKARETPEDASQPEPDKPLVPITHLTSNLESVSKEELS